MGSSVPVREPLALIQGSGCSGTVGLSSPRTPAANSRWLAKLSPGHQISVGSVGGSIFTFCNKCLVSVIRKRVKMLPRISTTSSP